MNDENASKQQFFTKWHLLEICHAPKPWNTYQKQHKLSSQKTFRPSEKSYKNDTLEKPYVPTNRRVSRPQRQKSINSETLEKYNAQENSTWNPMLHCVQKLTMNKYCQPDTLKLWNARNTKILKVFEQYILYKDIGRLGLSSWEASAPRLGQLCLGLSARECRGRLGDRCRPATCCSATETDRRPVETKHSAASPYTELAASPKSQSE